MDNSEIKRIIECLLFSAGEKPLQIRKLLEVIGEKDKDKIVNAIKSLKKDYDEKKGGLQISAIAGGYQMCTRKEYGSWIKKYYKEVVTRQLSPSAVETLAIIAYRQKKKQPITRAEIEKIRGVDVSGVIRSLVDKKLIKVAGKKNCIGHPSLYKITDNFLRYFGLRDITEMPELEE